MESQKSKMDTILDCVYYLVNRPKIWFSTISGKAYNKPINITLLLTFKCNLNCISCFFDKKENKQVLTKKEIFKLIDQFKMWGIKQITLSGGEPLVRNELLEIITYIKKKGLWVGIITNGTLITKNISKKFSELGVNKVSVSIDGIGKINDKIRGGNNFKRSIRGLNLLLKENIPEIRINSVITSKNLENIEKIYDFAKKRE